MREKMVKKNNTSSKVYKLIVIVFFLIFVVNLSGCVFSKYKTFTWRKDIAHFSFEYPSYYYKNDYFDSDTKPPNFITITFKKNHDIWYQDTYLYISLYKADKLSYDAKTALELAFSIQQGSHPEISVLERSQTIVAGLEAEQISYSYTERSYYSMSISEADKYATFSMVGSILTFSKNGVIWEIRTAVEYPLSEQTKEDVNHILQTFKILP